MDKKILSKIILKFMLRSLKNYKKIKITKNDITICYIYKGNNCIVYQDSNKSTLTAQNTSLSGLKWLLNNFAKVEDVTELEFAEV